MGGIAGMINLDGNPIHQQHLDLMAQSAAYRGVDGIHTWQDKQVGFVSLALHVTPESVLENQPLVKNQITLIADARIDNRTDLIAELKLDLPAITDADLILAAYERWGVECTVHLIGDFAFAIWDQSEQRLLLARDPMGMRGIYYYRSDKQFIFATEIKQIVAVPGMPIDIHEQALGVFLAGPQMPPEWTCYQDIYQLPAGHALTLQDGNQRIWKFWDIDPDHRITYKKQDEYGEHFRELFKDAVLARLRSIKPIGLSLSGGMDSGSVASMVGWLTQNNPSVDYPAPLQTFSHAYTELPQCDERHISRLITDHFGFPAIDVPTHNAYPLANYPDYAPDRDDPFVGVYQNLIELTLSMAKERGVGLMLTGGRGDLLTSGSYFDYWEQVRSGQWKRLWRELVADSQQRNTSVLSIILRKMIWTPDRFPQGRNIARQLLGRPPLPQKRLYPDWVNVDFAKKMHIEDVIRQSTTVVPTHFDAERKWRYETIFTPMQMWVANWSDRDHAKYGMGYADPYSDRRLTEFILAIPPDEVNKPRQYKHISRQAMQGIMPESVRQNVRKIIPLPSYLESLRHKSRDTVFDLIDHSVAHERGYIDKFKLRQYYESMIAGKSDHPDFWWSLSVEMWLRNYWSE